MTWKNSRRTSIYIGIILALIAEWLAVAYVVQELWWFATQEDWTYGDRGLFLGETLVVSFMGGMLGGWYWKSHND